MSKNCTGMTDDAKRIAIAEACRWTQVYQQKSDGWLWGESPDDGWHILPDYLNDLNAMHEAEKTLTDDEYKQYRRILTEDTEAGREISATARQRAEAFLRTTGRWEDEG